MRRSEVLIPYQWDRLVVRYRHMYTGARFSVGKRVSADCPLTHEERRIYVEKGLAHVVKAINTRLQCGLAEALKIVNQARGVTNWRDHASNGRQPPKAMYAATFA